MVRWLRRAYSSVHDAIVGPRTRDLPPDPFEDTKHPHEDEAAKGTPLVAQLPASPPGFNMF